AEIVARGAADRATRAAADHGADRSADRGARGGAAERAEPAADRGAGVLVDPLAPAFAAHDGVEIDGVDRGEVAEREGGVVHELSPFPDGPRKLRVDEEPWCTHWTNSRPPAPSP